MRIISCWTGMTKDEIVNDGEKEKEEWNKIKSNVKILDTVVGI